MASVITMVPTGVPSCQAAAMSPYKWQESGGGQVLGPAAAWDRDMMVCGCLLFDEQAGIYTLYYTGKNDTGNPMIGIATSTSARSGWTVYASNPVFGCGSNGSWDEWGVWGPCVVRDGTTYKMWYGGYNGTSWSIGYATSPDGKNWTRDASNPVLSPGDSSQWDRTSVYYPCVIKDAGGYRMLYTGYNSSKGCIGYAISADGINWTKSAQNPVLLPSGQNNFYKTTVFSPCVLNISGEFRMYFTGYDGSTYAIGYANSSNAKDWKIYSQQILRTGSSWEGYLHRNPAVAFTGSAYLMMYTAGVSANRVGEAEGWNNVPLAPDWNFPANNTLSGDSTPAMSWVFRDYDSDDDQTAFQVQFDDNQTFNTVDRDTGKVLGSKSSYEVATPLPDGAYFFRVRLWDSDNDFGEWSKMLKTTIDTTPPSNPTSLSSTSHVQGQWSSNPNITVAWSGASDATSGLAGYSILWDQSAETIPDGTYDIGATISQSTNPQMKDSNSIYFHIRSIDNIGLAAPGGVTIGPFLLDRSPPVNPVVDSTSHRVGAWSNSSVVKAAWSGANGTGSNVAAYSFSWDGSCATLPDTVPECNSSVANATSPGLAEGIWYFHIRTKDEAGNWAPAASHFGPVMIDYTPPWNPLNVTSVDHLPGIWSANNRVTVQWSGINDTLSQIADYSFVWDNSSGTVPDENADCWGSISQATSPALQDGTNHFFHIRARDIAGNWNTTAVHCGPFWIDTSPPMNPQNVRSVSHQPQAWSRQDRVWVEWSYPEVGEGRCGLGGVSVAWSCNNSTVPDLVVDLDATVNSTKSPSLAAGPVQYFHIRACNILGTWACETVHIGPFWIDYVPPANPRSLFSMDCTPLQWSNRSTVGVSWIPGFDELSGIAGYSLAWDRIPGTLPPENIAISDLVNRTTSPTLSEGIWYFHMRAADAAGNWAPIAAHVGPFLIDSTPPVVVEFQINGGTQYSTSSSIQLEVGAADQPTGSGLAGMRLRIGSDDWSPWEPYLSCRNMTVDRPDGDMTMEVQVKDRANNTGPVRSSSIFLDRSPPAVSGLAIDKGAPITNKAEIVLGITAADPSPGSGLAGISLSRDGTRWGGWEPYNETLPLSLVGDDGPQKVHVRVRDNAGLESPAAMADIILDRQAPTASSISIAGGAGTTRTLTVELRLAALDPQPGSGIGTMSFSEDGALWTDWEEFSSSSSYTFSPDNGLRTVMFRARDRAMNIGDAVHASIWLDTIPPTVLWSDLVDVNGTNASLAVALSEPGRVALHYGLSEAYNATAASEALKPYHILNLAGLQPGQTYHYSLTATDALGNAATGKAGLTFSVPAAPEPRAPGEPSSGPPWSGILVQSVTAIALAVAAVMMAIRYKTMRRPGDPPSLGGGPHV